jgi:hypothetical protein
MSDPDAIKISEERHDWLGHGFYFWENNLERAWQWAEEKKRRGIIEEPAVIGGIIFLGNCCDLMDPKQIEFLKSHYLKLVKTYTIANAPLPRNRNIASDKNGDMVLRELDCTVVEFMHSQVYNKHYDIPDVTTEPYDTVRCIFPEGAPLYDGAGFKEKTHTQICIRNLNCIKGFFIPRTEHNFKEWEKEKYHLSQQKSLLN